MLHNLKEYQCLSEIVSTYKNLQQIFTFYNIAEQNRNKQLIAMEI